LDQALKSEPVSFSPSKKITQAPEIKEKPKRKEVNLDELKKVLDESLKKAANPPSDNSSETGKNNDENPQGL